MEFEYSGTIYFDVDAIFEECRELNYIYTEDIYAVVRNAVINRMAVDAQYFVEGWMIDSVVTEVKKRIDKELEGKV